MSTIICNNDLIKDSHNISMSDYKKMIHTANTNMSHKTYYFDPYCKGKRTTLLKGKKFYTFSRSERICGISGVSEFLRISDNDGDEPEIQANDLVMINFDVLPILSIETLTAYIPEVPWDDFGNHYVLNRKQAKVIDNLWNTFLKQNKALFDAIQSGDYFLSTDNSKLNYLFIKPN